MKKLVVILLLGAISINLSFADSRIKHLRYEEGAVYNVSTNFLIATNIYMPKKESIENVTIGDAQAWDIKTLANKNMIVLKPTADSGTNLIVTTYEENYGRRIYAFSLNVSKKNTNDTFVVEFENTSRKMSTQNFTLPRQTQASISTINKKYTYSGSLNIKPIKVYDDGTFTYFVYGKHTEVGTIYALEDDKKESLVNYHMDGNTLVVERIARQFTIRNGTEIICIFNEQYPIAPTGTLTAKNTSNYGGLNNGSKK